jgi:hypothetical protein
MVYEASVINVSEPLNTKMNLTCLKTMFLPRNRHMVSFMKANQSMLYKEIVFN